MGLVGHIKQKYEENKGIFNELSDLHPKELYNILKKFLDDYAYDDCLYNELKSTPGKLSLSYKEDSEFEITNIKYVIDNYDYVKVELSPFSCLITAKKEHGQDKIISKVPYEHFHKIYLQ